MPITKVQEYSATPGSNSDVDGTNIAENCSPAGINDAIRGIMAHIKTALSGSDDNILTGTAGTNGNVAIFNGDGDLVDGGAVPGSVSDGAVTTAKIADDAVTTAKIADGSVTAAKLADGALPSGAVSAFAMSTPPSGWLECDGSAVSRTTYADLFTAIGTTFGTGDGSTTFNLPDFRGEFLRGWDNGAGVDSGRTFGSSQSDIMKDHQHSIMHVANGTPGGDSVQFTSTKFINVTLDGTTRTESLTRGIDATDDDGGTETRPRNVAVLYCIKT